MFNSDIINKYKTDLREAIHGTNMFYAWAYNDGPDIGMRKYGDEHNHVQDVILDGISWLIAGEVYQIANGTSTRLTSCSQVAAAPAHTLCVCVRAQGMIDGVIDTIPLGSFGVTEQTIVSNEFGLLRLD